MIVAPEEIAAFLAEEKPSRDIERELEEKQHQLDLLQHELTTLEDIMRQHPEPRSFNQAKSKIENDADSIRSKIALLALEIERLKVQSQ